MHLPEYAVGAEAGKFGRGVVKRVHCRQADGGLINHADHAQNAVRVAEFDQKTGDRAAQEKLLVLLFGIVRHGAVGVARLDVAAVEGEMLFGKVQIDHAHMQMRPFFPTAALAAIGREGVDHDAVGLAGAAVGALRAVDIQTAAAKAQINQLTVVAVIDAVNRRDHLRGRQTLGQVATRILIGAVQLELGQLLMFGSHACVLKGGPK